ncbi:nuclear transport factor 2 family protein [Arabidopsis lyrata subsp. lyrata]|uniref:Nuclear transport factor 2 family protein n=1 Tax=Arabidopsis lyrata subsp. lyrata TaxID=81972 RepID=D7MVS6_ARALL|nr:putative G3BP-like protein isoform X1 [Arabidopsis lyrata subsp. lyrata]EFH39350.1 nuclear transport factor 2 family protein [Arabidopsis lyrata subsp. lyrata]|eukprot:XP_002863091.1 putative G3BP-like protein isoform X1 [Arabidopsis lyrata subsp. lyrata]
MAMLGAQQVPTAACTPDMVGNAFVPQYYHILHQSPEHVHRFYQEISKLGRPEENGLMSITSTLQAIDKKIMELGYGVVSAEIATVDSQESYGGGVLVLVTGYLTGKDNVRRMFSQTFFLAPQETGYFVLNDMFRYSDEAAIVHGNQIPVNNIQVPVNTYQDTDASKDIPDDFVQEKYVQENHAVKQTEVLSKSINGPEVFTPSEDEQVSATEEVPAPEIVNEAPIEAQKVGESDSRTGEVPKRSYASIVKMKENAVPMSASRTPTKVEPKKQEEQAIHIPLPTPLSEKSDSGANVAVNENNQDNERALGPSIYLKGLPLDATPALLETEFQKFGLIRTNGIQVRSQKGFCFGFVEFESASSMQSAIEASPVLLNGHKVVVEEKRSTARGNYRGRSAFGVNTGYRNEGGRGRGSFGGGRGGYGRTDFNGYGNNRGNNRGGYANRANGDGGGFPRANGNNGRVRRGGGIDANRATKPVDDAPRVSVTA